MNFDKSPILLSPTGSARYGYAEETSDQDFMVLTEAEDRYAVDKESVTDYFFISLDTFRSYWGHPLRLADLVSDCVGNERLCAFLREHRREIPYAAPERTAGFGLAYIARGERGRYNSTIKPALRTAMILSHMAAHAEDPFLLSEEEKSILIRSRTGGVSLEERVDIYRRTICPENLDRLMRMPDHPTIKNELFQLIEEVIAS